MKQKVSGRWKRNFQHWSQNVDVENLRDGRSAPIDLDRQLALYGTQDIRRVLQFLSPLKGKVLLDLGGGLGLMAILLARLGASVVIADLSVSRLKAARGLAERSGVDEKICFVACVGEDLPFLDRVFDRQTTKSVLIHTQLKATSGELTRTLHPFGKAAFIEPLSRNPLVNLYRRIAAPRIWREITTYFTPRQLWIVSDTFERAGWTAQVERLYFLAFLASVFSFTLKSPRAYRIAETLLLWLDAIVLIVFPALRRLSWFSIILISPTRRRSSPHR